MALTEDADDDASGSENQLLINDVASPKIRDLFEQRLLTVRYEVDRATGEAVKAAGDVRIEQLDPEKVFQRGDKVVVNGGTRAGEMPSPDSGVWVTGSTGLKNVSVSHQSRHPTKRPGCLLRARS